MKFMLDYLPGTTGGELNYDELLALVQPEFTRAGANVRLVSLDPHSAMQGGDSPYVARPYSLKILVVEIDNLDTLTRYASDTGRAITMMAAGYWESINQGRIILTHRLFVSADAYLDREVT